MYNLKQLNNKTFKVLHTFPKNTKHNIIPRLKSEKSSTLMNLIRRRKPNKTKMMLLMEKRLKSLLKKKTGDKTGIQTLLEQMLTSTLMRTTS